MSTSATAPGLAAADFTYVSELVRRRSAISLAPAKTYLVEARLTPLVAELGLRSVAELVAALRRATDRDLEGRVVEAMTTNETFWFRDAHPFTALRQDIVPDLLQRGSASRSLRIWSAACSTGQELYSIAMLLDTDFPELAGWAVHLLGTDLSSAVVAKATEGLYTPTETGRGLPPLLKSRYLRPEGTGYRVVPSLRSRTRFEKQNLVEPWPARQPHDVIFLRNVLIYFDLDVKRMLVQRAHRALRPGGYLVLGAGETLLGIDVPFRLVHSAGAVSYQKPA